VSLNPKGKGSVLKQLKEERRGGLANPDAAGKWRWWIVSGLWALASESQRLCPQGSVNR